MTEAARSERKTQNRVINLLARYAATNLARLTGADVVVLQGGTLAWIEAGLPHGFQVI